MAQRLIGVLLLLACTCHAQWTGDFIPAQLRDGELVHQADTMVYTNWRDNCVLWMPFSTDKTAAFYDYSPEQNDGAQATADNRPAWSSGTVVFDGINDFYSIDDDDTLSFGNGSADSAFSALMWVKLDALGAARGLLGKENGTNGEWTVFVRNDNKVGMNFFDNTVANSVGRFSTMTINTNWHHVAFTYTGTGGTNGVAIFVDGTEESAYGANSGGTYSAMHNTTVAVKVGVRYVFSNVFLDGTLDDIRLYGRKLSAAEIAAIVTRTQK